MTDLTIAAAYLDSKRPADALRTVTPYLAAHPDDVTALILAGRALLAQGELAEARKLVEHATAVAPTSDQALRVLSIILSRQKHFVEATAAAEAAQRLAPSSWLTHLARAEVDHAQGRVTPNGLAAAQQALRLAPNEPDSHVVRGNLHRAQREFAAAADSYRAALALAPEHPAARNNLALVAMQRGRLGVAARDVLGLLATDPLYSAANLNIRILMRGVVAQIFILLLVLATLELYATGLLTLTGDIQPGSSTARLLPVCAVVLGIVITGWRLLRLRRTAGDRFRQFVEVMRTDDRRSVVYAGICGGVLVLMIVACFTPFVVTMVLFATSWLVLLGVFISSRRDLARQRALLMKP